MLSQFIFCMLISVWSCAADTDVFINYGHFWSNNTAKTKNDFIRQFELAVSFDNAPILNNARLYQMRPESPGPGAFYTSAIDAAMHLNTKLLLGMWLDAETTCQEELEALNRAFQVYDQTLVDLLVGISVGSENLQREDVDATVIKSCIDTVHANISTYFAAPANNSLRIGHVDTAVAWNKQSASIKALINASDFIGTTIYPFWDNQTISNGKASFQNSLSQNEDWVAKPVWIVETGWPFSGPQRGDAIANTANMQTFWNDVGCDLDEKRIIGWFQLQSDSHDGYDWGIFDESGTPRINLTCPPERSYPSQTSSSSSTSPVSNKATKASSTIAGPGSTILTSCIQITTTTTVTTWLSTGTGTLK